MTRRRSLRLHRAWLSLALFAAGPLDAAPLPPSLPMPPAFADTALEEPIDPGQPDTARLSAAIFHESNRIRRQLGLRPFAWHEKLDRAADLQARSSALSQIAGHLQLFPGQATPADRVRHVGLKARTVGENAALIPLLAFNSAHGYYEDKSGVIPLLRDGTTDEPVEPHTYASLALVVVDGWMNSPGHRANLVNPEFHYLGCSARTSRSISGLEMVACVQVFFTPLGRRP